MAEVACYELTESGFSFNASPSSTPGIGCFDDSNLGSCLYFTDADTMATQTAIAYHH